MNNNSKAWINGILGTWLLVSAFLNFSPAGNMWDKLIVGIIVAIVGFMMVKDKAWQGWTSGILGVWLIIAAFIPSLQQTTGSMWNDLIVGLIIAIAGYTAIEKSNA